MAVSAVGHSCQRHRAILIVEQSRRARGADDVSKCVDEGTAVIMSFRRGPGAHVLYVPGPEADYSREGHRQAFEACTSLGRAQIEHCLRESGWEPVL